MLKRAPCRFASSSPHGSSQVSPDASRIRAAMTLDPTSTRPAAPGFRPRSASMGAEAMRSTKPPASTTPGPARHRVATSGRALPDASAHHLQVAHAGARSGYARLRAAARHRPRVASARPQSLVLHAPMRAMIAAGVATLSEHLRAWFVEAASGKRWPAPSSSALPCAPPIATRIWASRASAMSSAVTHAAMRCHAQTARGHLALSRDARALCQAPSPVARARAAHGTKLASSTADSPSVPFACPFPA